MVVLIIFGVVLLIECGFLIKKLQWKVNEEEMNIPKQKKGIRGNIFGVSFLGILGIVLLVVGIIGVV